MASTDNTNTEKRIGVLHNKISYLKNCRNRISRRNRKTIHPTAIFIQRTRVILKRYLQNVIQDAINCASEDRRQSVSAVDIAKALKKQGLTKCDESFPNKRSCPEEKSSPEVNSCAIEDRRQSISAVDIPKPLKKQGLTKCDESFPSKRSCPEEKSSSEDNSCAIEPNAANQPSPEDKDL